MHTDKTNACMEFIFIEDTVNISTLPRRNVEHCLGTKGSYIATILV